MSGNDSPSPPEPADADFDTLAGLKLLVDVGAQPQNPVISDDRVAGHPAFVVLHRPREQLLGHDVLTRGLGEGGQKRIGRLEHVPSVLHRIEKRLVPLDVRVHEDVDILEGDRASQPVFVVAHGPIFTQNRPIFEPDRCPDALHRARRLSSAVAYEKDREPDPARRRRYDR